MAGGRLGPSPCRSRSGRAWRGTSGTLGQLRLGPMRAFSSGRSYDTYGGGLPLAAAGYLLEEAAWRADCGVDHFEATAFLLTPDIDARHLPESQAEFEADRSRLPRIRWERSKRKLTLEYESHIATAPEMHVRHNFSRRHGDWRSAAPQRRPGVTCDNS